MVGGDGCEGSGGAQDEGRPWSDGGGQRAGDGAACGVAAEQDDREQGHDPAEKVRGVTASVPRPPAWRDEYLRQFLPQPFRLRATHHHDQVITPVSLSTMGVNTTARDNTSWAAFQHRSAAVWGRSIRTLNTTPA